MQFGHAAASRKYAIYVGIFLFIIALSLCFEHTQSMIQEGKNATIAIINPLTGNENFIFYKGGLFYGASFKANVTIFNAENLEKCQIHLKYNSTLLKCINITFPKETVFDNRTSFKIVDNDHGFLIVNATVSSKYSPFNGNTIFCQLTFEIIKYPSLNSKLTSNFTYDTENTFLLNFQGEKIPVEFKNGKYELNWFILYDFSLPATIFLLSLLSMIFYPKIEILLKDAFEEKKITVKDAAIIVVIMGVIVSIIAFVPSMLLITLFLLAYSILMFTFTYLFTRRWYVAILPPVVFVCLYLFSWNLYVLNFFALTFALLITLYLNNLFTWKVTFAFAGLLTTMDIIQVLLTRKMVEAATGLIRLQLPIAVMFPIFPPVFNGRNYVQLLLGLGDLFFAALLAAQTSKKYGNKIGLISIASMSISFFIFETLFLTFGESLQGFPGTLVIICGWLPVILIQKLREKTFKVV